MITFRFANKGDTKLYYNWASDPETRKNSYSSGDINYKDHQKWFHEKLNSNRCFLYLFEIGKNNAIGQVRIEKLDNNTEKKATISISLDKDYRGKGYGSLLIKMATEHFLEHHPEFKVLAYVFNINYQSYKSFIKAGYIKIDEQIVKGVPSWVLKSNDYD